MCAGEFDDIAPIQPMVELFAERQEDKKGDEAKTLLCSVVR